jgi:hypothetical protein
VADIFQEVDEEVRREQLQRLWERYGIYLIALAILIVVGVAGWRGYQYWEQKKAAEAGNRFEQAVALSEQGKHSEAEAAFSKIAADAPSGYRALARLRAAAELANTDIKAAVAAYDALASDGSVGQSLQDIAALRAAMLLVDTAPFDEMRRRLDPLSEPGRTFRHTAREMLALSAWRNGDAAAARRYIDLIANDADTPQGVRSRMDVLSALLASGGKS